MGDLIKYLPQGLQGIGELIALSTAQQGEITALQDAIAQGLENQFVETANAAGLSRLEKAFALAPAGQSTQEERRFALRTRMLEQRPLTAKGLLQVLERLCGRGNCIVAVSPATHTLTVRLALASKRNLGAAVDLINAVKPATIRLDVDLLYNRHSMVKQLTHGQLKERVHLGIRAEVL